MLCIVYISSIKNDYTTHELKTTYDKFKKFNDMNGITGLLIHYDKNVIQYIEGEEDIIRNLYNRIQKDNTHKSIIKLTEETSTERRLDDFKLCLYKNKEKYTFIEFIDICINNIQNKSLIKLFNTFVKTNIRYIH